MTAAAKIFKRWLLRIAFPLARLYWFLFRPETEGAKVVVACNGEVLLLRHSYIPDIWGLPGGGMKRGESPESAARREVHEECGIEVQQLRALGVMRSTAEWKKDTVHLFAAELAVRPPVILDMVEIIEHAWFSLDGLPDALGLTTKEALTRYRAEFVS